MAGTPDVTTDFDTKTELDFRNRLIAKFAIPRARSFWGTGFEAAPKTALYPSNDRVGVLCQDVVDRIQKERAAIGDMGELLVEWAKLEERILPRARQLTARNVSVREALLALVASGQLDKDVASGLDEVRRVRNSAAHTPGRLEKADVDRALQQLRKLLIRLPPDRD